MDEKELIFKSLQGEESAFNQLVIMHRDKIYRECVDLVKDEAAADDLTQDTFVQAYRSLKNFKQRSSFYTWIWRIAHNLSVNYIKRDKRRKEVEQKNVIKQCYDSEYLTEYLSLLPYKQRIVFEMYYLDQLTQKEIADKLGVAHGTVRSRLHYAKKHLQNFLK